MIKIENLCKYFWERNRKVNTLHNINFEIKKGESIGLTGGNGSGKTTLLRIISGVYSPSEGIVNVKGKILPLLELGGGFHPELTGRENVFLYSSILGVSKRLIKSKIDDIIKFSELEGSIDRKLRTYSNGMKLRLAFSIGMQCSTDIFLIDEVLAVGDISFQRKCIKKIKELKEEKKTFLFASHDFGLFKKICDRIILLNKGKIEFEGGIKDTFMHYKKILKNSDDIK